MDMNTETLQRATGIAGGVVHNLSPDDWDKETPCTEWDVRALLNHLVGGNLISAARLSRNAIPDLGSDFLGDDPTAAYDASVRDMVTAFSREGALDETFQHPMFGDRPGRDLLRLRLFEALAHGWDLAVATGQPRDRDPELYKQALEFARPVVANRPAAANDAFAPPQEVAADASPADQYAALLGRRVPA